MSQASASLDGAVAESLTKFVHALKDENWIGREREAVSAYVMGFLSGSVKPGTVLSSLEQIGIEVGVPQLPGANRKKVVCKDLVIWSAPRMTCWDSDGSVRRYPIAIMEWG